MSHHMVDPELMVRVLRKSIDFENDLARSYPVEDLMPSSTQTQAPDLSGEGTLKYADVISSKGSKEKPSAAEDQAQFEYRFKGIISECFDAYLGTWVQYEEKQLVDALEKMTAPGLDRVMEQDDERFEDDDEGAEPRYLYASAPEIFATMKATMTKCSGFSTHQTLFDIFMVFRKVLTQYIERLSAQLPVPAKVAGPFDSPTVQVICCVIGTAEYCEETLPQFGELLTKVIDSSFQDRVNFDVEQDGLGGVVSRAMQVLVTSVVNSLDDVFNRMTRLPWASFSQDVGDQSLYVSEIGEKLSAQFGPLAQYLSKLHYRSFCGKFVQAFVLRFVTEIFRCRKINETGAQQLLLDASLIKTTLLEVPVTAGKVKQMPTAYSNYVLKEMGRAEAMLKVLSSPDTDPSSVMTLLGEGPEAHAEAERLLALRVGYDGDPSILSSAGEDHSDSSGVPSLRNLRDTLNQHSAKTSEDLKKLSGDVKKKLTSFQLPGLGMTGTRKGP